MNVDVAIVGSGFAGSILAMIARRLGRSVVLLEKGRHPRFAIGESSTPLANLLLEELARSYDLPRLLPLTKWGAWQKAYPEIGCGLKRGFTFYHHTFDQPFAGDPQRSDQLLVGASPRDEVADTHWYRPDFDHFLAREAESAGVVYLDEVELKDVSEQASEVILSGHRRGEPVVIRAQFVVDATGPRGFLHRALSLQEEPFENFPATQGLYTHFTGVGRMEDLRKGETSNIQLSTSNIERAITEAPSVQLDVGGSMLNVGSYRFMQRMPEGRVGGLPFYACPDHPPYPPDAAALHHVFDGGWIWVLHFNNGVTSAGAAVTDALADALRLSEGGAAWQRLLARLPTVGEQFAEAKAVRPFVHLARLPFRSRAVVGKRWALLPSAAGVVDPLLSTGFPLTLFGVARLAEAMEKDWGQPRFDRRLAAYGEQTLKELDATARIVGALYGNMRDFELFAALTLLYFAAASFSESARRMHRLEQAASFLLIDHPQFGPALRDCCERSRRPLTPSQRSELIEAIYRTIAPIDVAGLGRRERRNWHPAADDTPSPSRPVK